MLDALPIALGGMVLPFGLDVALSIPLYHRFIDQSIKFTYFMLFTGVSYSITAFPVLCRILTEFKLVDTTVGVEFWEAGVYRKALSSSPPPSFILFDSVNFQLAHGFIDTIDPPMWITTMMGRVSIWSFDQFLIYF